MLALRASSVRDGPPLGSKEVSSTGGGVQFGKRAITGAPTAFNYGAETAVLERIELVDPPPGIESRTRASPGRGAATSRR